MPSSSSIPVPPAQSTGPRGVLFDLDGTLVDHFATLYRCYELTLRQLGLRVPAPEEVKRAVGGSMEVTMGHWVPPERLAEAAALWRDLFARHFLDEVHLMPGAKWILRQLHERGFRLGVLTNKIGEQSRGICAHLGLDSFLDLVLGANDTPYRKPQPEIVETALARLEIAPGATLLVGDSPFDIETARAGGLRCACVSTGTHAPDELRAARADAIYPDLFALGAGELNLPVPANPRPA